MKRVRAFLCLAGGFSFLFHTPHFFNGAGKQLVFETPPT
jgi:hypothetical protein